MRRTLLNLPLSGALLALALTSGCAHKPKPAPAAPTTPAPTTEQVPTPPPPPPPAPAPAPPPAPAIKSEDLGVVLFDFDSAALSEKARATLDQNARVLRDHADARVLIDGNCDERGTDEYNLALGEKRAQATRDYLVAAGIATSRIDVISYGKEHPVDPGHDEAAWAKNRRAGFAIK